MNKDTGGPAFPTDSLDDYGHVNGWSSGMTLRDYFAAKAMQGFLVDVDCKPDDLPLIAVAAYLMADAMIKARKSSAVMMADALLKTRKK